jgi:hypothetical protein
MTTHFSPEAWADFARRNLLPDVETRMQEHLESGCQQCVQTLHIWLSVLEAASGLNLHHPPEEGIRFVKALYRAFPRQRSGSARFEVSHLALPAFVPTESVRSSEAERRHFVFQHGNVLLEIDFDPQPQSGVISMAGQLMDAAAPSTRFENLTVVLLSEEAELAQTHTNEFGKFDLEFALAVDVMLVVQLDTDSILVTPLPSFVLDRTMSAPGFGIADGQ